MSNFVKYLYAIHIVNIINPRANENVVQSGDISVYYEFLDINKG